MPSITSPSITSPSITSPNHATRTFAIDSNPYGSDVVDNEGRRWAAFDADQPRSPEAAARSRDVIAAAYALGRDDAGEGRERPPALVKGNGPGGRSWDLRVGDAPSLARMPRGAMDIHPPGGARRLLALAAEAYAAARIDLDEAPAAPAPR